MPGRVIGRYEIDRPFAQGGMAAIHLGRAFDPGGTSRIVAAKRLLENFSRDPDFVSMLLDEARLVSLIKHTNVVAIFDVVSENDEVFVIMEHVHGETLARLMIRSIETNSRVPLSIAAAVMRDVLRGLHAAHTVTNERGESLGIVHRDVSPQNIMVSCEGMAQVFDFGIAKALGRMQTTADGSIKGKFGYMSPEQLRGAPVDARSDVYAAGVVLWEMLVGERLFVSRDGQSAPLLGLEMKVEPPSRWSPGLPAVLDPVVMRALERDANRRFSTALHMADAIEASLTPAQMHEVGTWVRTLAADTLRARAEHIAELESKPRPEQISTGRATANPKALRGISSEAPALGDTGTVTTTIQLMRQSAKRKALVLIGLGAAILLLIGLSARAFLGDPTNASHSTSSTISASPQAERPIDDLDLDDPSASATTVSPNPSATPGGKPHSVRPSGPSKRGPSSTLAPKTDCTPPYVIDARGHKQFKRGCFH